MVVVVAQPNKSIVATKNRANVRMVKRHLAGLAPEEHQRNDGRGALNCNSCGELRHTAGSRMAADHSSPQAVFASAQRALAEGDWETFYSALERTTLLRLGRYFFRLVGSASALGQQVTALCEAHGVSAAVVAELTTQSAAMDASARAALQSLEASAQHHQLVTARSALEAAAAKQVDDLAAFNAAAERLVRATMGGGSISSSLLAGDSLEQVQLKGRQATALRRPGERVSFVCKRSKWLMKLPLR